MPLDPATLKARLGIDASDTSKDAVIDVVAGQAQGLAENYCDRGFDVADQAEDFPNTASSAQLFRYPVTAVTGFWRLLHQNGVPLAEDRGGDVTIYRLDKARGIVWPGGWGWASNPDAQLHIEYTGGLETWPPDLDWAVTAIFDLLWAETPGGGVEPGAGGATAFDVVKRFSVVGAYSVELGSSGDAGSTSGGGGDNSWGLLPPSITSVLDGYRRSTRLGIG
jgi:hypothetical protein